MRIAIGCDHGGINLKPAIIKALNARGIEHVDFGAYDTSSVDYPDYALKVAEAVSNGECDKGVILCGTGIGIAISANKVKGIRAAVCHDVFTGQMSAEHNDANVIAMGGRIVTPELAADILNAWLDTPFGGGRHERRVDKIKEIEDKYFK
ncbi:MAG: ribose 5-phosphate isomerase B [Clostridia bacterium]|jgi:ribose 5-phosphate isomerase B|nr:ribose 5-phosphate isomerase B [Clostridia bacterium]MCX4367168.1 ribose 5-phosphate isomerase B [Clostridia bacterium]